QVGSSGVPFLMSSAVISISIVRDELWMSSSLLTLGIVRPPLHPDDLLLSEMVLSRLATVGNHEAELERASAEPHGDATTIVLVAAEGETNPGNERLAKNHGGYQPPLGQRLDAVKQDFILTVVDVEVEVQMDTNHLYLQLSKSNCASYRQTMGLPGSTMQIV